MAKFDLDKLLSEIDELDDATEAISPREAQTPHDSSAVIHSAEVNESSSPSMHPMANAPSPERMGIGADQSETLHKEPLRDIYNPGELAPIPAGATLRTSLVETGAVEASLATAAESVMKQSPGLTLVRALLDQGIEEASLLEAVARETGFGFERLSGTETGEVPEDSYDGLRVQRLGADFCKKHCVLPLRKEGDVLVIGLSDPDDVYTLEDTRLRLTASLVRIVLVPPTEILAVLEALSDSEGETENVESILSDIEEDDVRIDESDDEEVDLEREAAESPVIRYVNYIIQTATKEGASDIHIEPGDKALKVRFRIDGVLFEMMQPPAKMAAAITSRLKIMANLDISERRVPQDGRIRCQVHGRKLDLRVSTLPCGAGEKTVMRILDTKSINVELEDLGFDTDTLQIWKREISQPHGIVLVTGPTGSGKTTTLYSSLRQMDKKTKNVSTVEDPIEYHLDGITQTQTHEKIGMTFSGALRALLRQDPDIIMVGEIRDMETAQIAIQAALTGHLVLSTLHTNDAPSAITRLVNIGIEPFLIGAGVNAVLAQRLVRRICSNCSQPVELTTDMQEFLDLQGLPQEGIREGAGCDRCRNLGYSGRVGLYELLCVDDQIRDIIARNPNITEFRRICCERGMVTLRQDGFAKVVGGETTIEEILRVTEHNA